jgi:hypothetical protein
MGMPNVCPATSASGRMNVLWCIVPPDDNLPRLESLHMCHLRASWSGLTFCSPTLLAPAQTFNSFLAHDPFGLTAGLSIGFLINRAADQLVTPAPGATRPIRLSTTGPRTHGNLPACLPRSAMAEPMLFGVCTARCGLLITDLTYVILGKLQTCRRLGTFRNDEK